MSLLNGETQRWNFWIDSEWLALCAKENITAVGWRFGWAILFFGRVSYTLWRVSQLNCSLPHAGTRSVTVLAVSTAHCSEECKPYLDMWLKGLWAIGELPKWREFPFVSLVAMVNAIRITHGDWRRNNPDWVSVNWFTSAGKHRAWLHSLSNADSGGNTS